MKKFSEQARIISRIFLILAFTLVISACDEGDSLPLGNVNDDTTVDIENMMDAVDKANIKVDELIGGGTDILTALNSVKSELLADTAVKSVEVGPQGLAIEYNNGVLGGIFIDPRDEEGPEPPEFGNIKKGSNKVLGGEGMIIQGSPQSKKTIILNPHYYERQEYMEQIDDRAVAGFEKTAFTGPALYINEECTLEKFAGLSEFGVIHVYSHGWAYPSETNIKDVYIMCGGEYVKATAQRYFADIKAKNIIIGYNSKSKKWKFWFNSAFFDKYNTFSGDSTLFYGGFCYSALGKWKTTIVDDMGGGAYIGFDWSVYTAWNAFWAKKMYYMMNDTTQAEPTTLDRWYHGINQNYYDESSKKHVSVEYYGTGSLTFWGDLFLSILPNPLKGEAGKDVSFKAKLEGNVPANVQLDWYFGDGTDKTSMVNDFNVVHKFEKDGNYNIRVMLYDKDSGDYLAEAVGKAQIGEPAPGIENCDYVTLTLFTDNYFTMSNEDEDNDFKSVTIVNVEAPIIWDGTQFSVTYDYTSEGGSFKSSKRSGTISGTISEDGTKVETISGTRVSHNILQNDMGYRHTESELTFTDISLKTSSDGKEYYYKAQGTGLEAYVPTVKFSYEYYDKISGKTKGGSLVKVNWGDEDDFATLNFFKKN